jgi:ABC-type multidrug transport system fused ATPase/permease subunit
MFTMVSNIQAIPYLCSRNLLFRRELASYCYSAAPYWLSHVLTVIPLQVLGYTCNMLLIFFLCHFPYNASYFFYFYFMGCFATMSSFYFAMFLAAVIQNSRRTLIVFPLCFLFLSTFAGFAIPVSDIPPFWSWAPYVDFARWSFQGLMTNQWESYDDDNSSGETVLEMYGMSGWNKYNSFWIAALATGIFIGLVYVAMRPGISSLEKVPYEDMIRYSLDTQKTLSGSDDKTDTRSQLHEKLLNENMNYDNYDAEKGGIVGGGEGKDTENPMQIERKHSLGTGSNHSSHSTPLHSQKGKKNNSFSEISTPSSRSLRFKVDSTGIKPSQHGYYLTFKDVCYSVDVKSATTGEVNELQILKNVSGRVEPKEMCALMGPSECFFSSLFELSNN